MAVDRFLHSSDRYFRRGRRNFTELMPSLCGEPRDDSISLLEFTDHGNGDCKSSQHESSLCHDKTETITSSAVTKQ